MSKAAKQLTATSKMKGTIKYRKYTNIEQFRAQFGEEQQQKGTKTDTVQANERRE